MLNCPELPELLTFVSKGLENCHRRAGPAWGFWRAISPFPSVDAKDTSSGALMVLAAAGEHRGSGVQGWDRCGTPLARPGIGVGSAALGHPLHVGLDRGFGDLEFILRAEHDELRARHRGGNVAGGHVEGVTRFDDLLVIGVPHG